MNWSDLNNYVSKFNIFAEPNKDKATQSEARFQTKALKADTGRSFIASDLIVNGSLSSDADVMIDGQTYGDVYSKGNIIVHGKVEGTVCGRNIDLVGAEIIGDIKAGGHLRIIDSSVRGDIYSITAELDSRINGNIAIHESLIIRSTADITGDIVAASVSIEEKAAIDGKLSIKQPAGPTEVLANEAVLATASVGIEKSDE